MGTDLRLTPPNYRPDIDGLRALAVLSVVGFHASETWVPGGFVGVDVFFVISGFLISNILYKGFESGTFSYADFYARRIKRIFPALLLVMSTSVLAGWYLLLPNEFAQLGKQLSAGAGFVANLSLWAESGYFDRAAETKPFLHLWSLGVEEQFYIFWPILLGVLYSRKIRRARVLVIVACLSFALCVFTGNKAPDANFFLPFSRIWELMLGALLAYLQKHSPERLPQTPRLRTCASTVGLLMILGSVMLLHEDLLFPGWWALYPTLGSVLIIAAGPTAFVNRILLGCRPAVWLGLISYPIYLWHWPLLSFAQIVEGSVPSFRVRALAVLLSLVLAALTYLVVELRYKREFGRLDLVRLSAGMSAMFGLGLFMFFGVIGPKHDSRELEQVVEATSDWDFPGRLQPVGPHRNFVHSMDAGPKTTVFIGDSHARQYAPAVVELLSSGKDLNSALFVTTAGCPPVPGVLEDKHPECGAAMQRIREVLEQPNIDTIVLSTALTGYQLDPNGGGNSSTGGYSYYVVDESGRKLPIIGAEGRQKLFESLENFVAGLATDRRVFYILPTPWGPDFAPRTRLSGSRWGELTVRSVQQGSRVEYRPEQRQLRNRVRELVVRAGAIPLDPTAEFCSDDRCESVASDGRPLFRDRSHLRPFYVKSIAKFLRPALE